MVHVAEKIYGDIPWNCTSTGLIEWAERWPVMCQNHCPEGTSIVGDIILDTEPYGYDGAYETVLRFNRTETKKETQKRLFRELRLKKERSAKKVAKEAKDRREYERLKKKFK